VPVFRHLLALVATALIVLAAALAARGEDLGPPASTVTSTTARTAAVQPVAAPDRRWPVDSEAVRTAVRIAAEHWGGDACGGAVAMTWTTLAAGTNATASWRNPSHAWDNSGENFDCRVELNAQAAYDWDKFCTVLVHELGHLRGHAHDEADHVMAAVYRGPSERCAATPEPGVPAPATAPAAAPAPAAARSLLRPADARPAAVKRTATRRARRARARARAAARARARSGPARERR
jgi:hypothetical protein